MRGQDAARHHESGRGILSSRLGMILPRGTTGRLRIGIALEHEGILPGLIFAAHDSEAEATLILASQKPLARRLPRSRGLSPPLGLNVACNRDLHGLPPPEVQKRRMHPSRIEGSPNPA